MANYTCEFSKIKDGDSTKYVQVPNENTAKRDTLVFAACDGAFGGLQECAIGGRLL